jgi:hypothetical protein
MLRSRTTPALHGARIPIGPMPAVSRSYRVCGGRIPWWADSVVGGFRGGRFVMMALFQAAGPLASGLGHVDARSQKYARTGAVI